MVNTSSKLVLLIGSICGANAWSTKANIPHRKSQPSILETMAQKTASLAIASSLAILPFTGAAPDASAATIDFTGSYSDPKHPMCPRLVAIEGTTAIITGADGNPGCVGGEGNYWRLIGKVVETTEGNDEIFVDFSPKGGPKNLVGKWEDSGRKSKDVGIRWPDGNKWTLEGRPEF